MSVVHFADFDGDNYITSCGWFGGRMSGLVEEVTCKSCKKTRRFLEVERGNDGRMEFTKKIRLGMPEINEPDQ